MTRRCCKKVLSGEFIYDTLLDGQGNLTKPSQWQNVEAPMALIAYGVATAPF
ncbi:MAG: hypothetical protein H7Z38_07535 [Rubrivivax sp.]|nr:hypothetical protein [Pyrinomonadaceae bacterium]